MARTKIAQSKDKRDNTWEPPAVTKTAITETKVHGPVTNDPALAEPQPPSEPATKLGFSFEMAFPLAARTKK
jgi:hypothetical protein